MEWSEIEQAMRRSRMLRAQAQRRVIGRLACAVFTAIALRNPSGALQPGPLRQPLTVRERVRP